MGDFIRYVSGGWAKYKGFTNKDNSNRSGRND